MTERQTVDELLLAAAAGYPPKAREVDALPVPPGWGPLAFRAAMTDACQQAADLKHAGRNGDARQAASAFAHQHRDAWGEDGPPDPLEPDPIDPTDPAALAAAITRR